MEAHRKEISLEEALLPLKMLHHSKKTFFEIRNQSISSKVIGKRWFWLGTMVQIQMWLKIVWKCCLNCFKKVVKHANPFLWFTFCRSSITGKWTFSRVARSNWRSNCGFQFVWRIFKLLRLQYSSSWHLSTIFKVKEQVEWREKNSNCLNSLWELIDDDDNDDDAVEANDKPVSDDNDKPLSDNDSNVSPQLLKQVQDSSFRNNAVFCYQRALFD